MASREDVHRLVDAARADQLAVIEQLLAGSVDAAGSSTPRRFSSAGTLPAERDLAERSEDVLRMAADGDESERRHADG